MYKYIKIIYNWCLDNYKLYVLYINIYKLYTIYKYI